ncbi:hypothetical protein LES60_06605 [Pectobacterium brasiliense]|uniref:hypothetical protein n=1 Tax=Pectobacterium brasiliense TaxID=180957 RepID=UPI001CE1400F|nr:hypothetical protein [Pectobacterium brasiliense]MCA5919291.1 hypothetical protein [Pectobacterium brasiliense]MCA5926322.1 hypothetical protein [Pectobacterium brasiliense]MCA5935662.1 hypothetical protein [Pectobacterium brasiliense]MCA5941593.1 hypothetical protein [Pectobacterium brasiliense]MCA5943275.1 hypothetical protein [Pectobacterium brasiliense]
MKAPDITEIEVTLFIHNSRYLESIMVSTCDMSHYGHILIGTHTVTVPIPRISDSELTNRQIAALKNQQQKIIADAQIQASQLEDQIQRLLCIEHHPSTTTDPDYIPY